MVLVNLRCLIHERETSRGFLLFTGQTQRVYHDNICNVPLCKDYVVLKDYEILLTFKFRIPNGNDTRALLVSRKKSFV